MNEAVLQTNIPELNLVSRGKVRDIYEIDQLLLIVATDRVSAFDVVLPNGIPDKGKVLTEVSTFWFDYFKGSVTNHLSNKTLDDLGLSQFNNQLQGRTMVCQKLKVLPVECIVRGYITGSGFKDYKKTGSVCGLQLPEGLVNSDRLSEPLFTPSTKAEQGLHDENISFDQMVDVLGQERADKLKKLSLEIYIKGAEYALKKGIIIADTKFEWGEDEDGNLILIDEILTMDSSRFWPSDDYEAGREQNSFDKQIVRNYLEKLDWNKTPPGPELPEDVIQKARQRYFEAYEKLTGQPFIVQNSAEGGQS